MRSLGTTLFFSPPIAPKLGVRTRDGRRNRVVASTRAWDARWHGGARVSRPEIAHEMGGDDADGFDANRAETCGGCACWCMGTRCRVGGGVPGGATAARRLGVGWPPRRRRARAARYVLRTRHHYECRRAFRGGGIRVESLVRSRRRAVFDFFAAARPKTRCGEGSSAPGTLKMHTNLEQRCMYCTVATGRGGTTHGSGYRGRKSGTARGQPRALPAPPDRNAFGELHSVASVRAGNSTDGARERRHREMSRERRARFEYGSLGGGRLAVRASRRE